LVRIALHGTAKSCLWRNGIRAVNIGSVERFWRGLSDAKTPRSSVELIARVEAVNDPMANAASGSLLVSLFREVQPLPVVQPLTAAGSLIVVTLLTRAKLTPLYAHDRLIGWGLEPKLARQTLRWHKLLIKLMKLLPMNR
jgi:hypothetical protein